MIRDDLKTQAAAAVRAAALALPRFDTQVLRQWVFDDHLIEAAERLRGADALLTLVHPAVPSPAEVDRLAERTFRPSQWREARADLTYWIALRCLQHEANVEIQRLVDAVDHLLDQFADRGLPADTAQIRVHADCPFPEGRTLCSDGLLWRPGEAAAPAGPIWLSHALAWEVAA